MTITYWYYFTSFTGFESFLKSRLVTTNTRVTVGRYHRFFILTRPLCVTPDTHYHPRCHDLAVNKFSPLPPPITQPLPQPFVATSEAIIHSSLRWRYYWWIKQDNLRLCLSSQSHKDSTSSWVLVSYDYSRSEQWVSSHFQPSHFLCLMVRLVSTLDTLGFLVGD